MMKINIVYFTCGISHGIHSCEPRLLIRMSFKDVDFKGKCVEKLNLTVHALPIFIVR